MQFTGPVQVAQLELHGWHIFEAESPQKPIGQLMSQLLVALTKNLPVGQLRQEF